MTGRCSLPALLLLVAVSSAAAGAILPGTVDLDSVEDFETPQSGSGGVPSQSFNNFIVYSASGDFAGTQVDGTKVLINANGNSADLSAPLPFDITSFYISNPNQFTPLTVTITCTPTGETRTVPLAADQGPTLVLPFLNCAKLAFEPAVPSSGRKLLGGQTSLPTTFALDNIALAARALVFGAPPPGVMTAAPTAAPTVAPTAAPTDVPTAAPSAPTPSAVPTNPSRPTTPTRPTRTRPRPTQQPLAASCPNRSLYRARGGCRRCVSRSSPFVRTTSDGERCYPPIALGPKSTQCSAAVLPAFIQTNLPPRRATVRCINPRKALVTLLLPTRSGRFTFLNSGSYVASSLRLDGNIRRVGSGEGELVESEFGDRRRRFQFIDTRGQLLTKWGKVVRLSGILSRPGDLLDFCFVAYLRVCPVLQ